MRAIKYVCPKCGGDLKIEIVPSIPLKIRYACRRCSWEKTESGTINEVVVTDDVTAPKYRCSEATQIAGMYEVTIVLERGDYKTALADFVKNKFGKDYHVVILSAFAGNTTSTGTPYKIRFVLFKGTYLPII